MLLSADSFTFSGLDGPRKGGLTLNIDDWNTFMQSADKVSSKPLTLSGVQFTMEVYVNDQSLAIWLHAAHTANRPEWHCKAEYALHWPRRARKDTKGLSTATIFRNGWTVSGWNARATLDVSVFFRVFFDVRQRLHN